MKDRLEAIFKHEKITPSRLADIIGVQRSGISHIMSGRNKPGLDFLSKLLAHFPHINGDWLITGQGPMLKNTSNKVTSGQLSIPVPPEVKETPKEPEKPKIRVEKPPVFNRSLAQPQQSMPEKENQLKTDKTIERVIVFYSDRSFIEYKPE